MSVTVLSGGVGGARFLSGLVQVLPQESINVIANTGDDFRLYNLHISPDIDIVIYTLAGIVNPETGWGIHGDTFNTLDSLRLMGEETWFSLGDRDFATHIFRSALLDQGKTLSEATKAVAKAHGLRLNLMPMSNQLIQTQFLSGGKVYEFQEYMVKERQAISVDEILFQGLDTAEPAPGVLESIRESDAILLAPSNPFISVGSILGVKGVRDAISRSPAPKCVVSPIVSGKAVKGPLANLMTQFGYEVSPLGIAQIYRGIIDTLVIDYQDESYANSIRDMGINVVVTETMMTSDRKKKNLAEVCLKAALG